MNKSHKIIFLYLLGLLSLALFMFIDNSKYISELLVKADRVRTDWGFAIYAIIGLLKMASLIAGITLPIVTTFMLIRQKTIKRKKVYKPR